MLLNFSYRPYSRDFKAAIRTVHGIWQKRQGILICISQNAKVRGFGEIAPLPWFGSETMAGANDYCASIPVVVSSEALRTVPPGLPACEYAIATALDSLANPPKPISPKPQRICALLPAGPKALTAWQHLWRQGHRTFKWKLGVYPIEQEMSWFHTLRNQLPATAQLRLDANGGLTLREAERWLATCDVEGGVEFFEQPLSPEHLPELMELAERFCTSLALDESVASYPQLEDCLRQGWPGIVVIKPAILGAPQRIEALCHEYAADVVISSVFETGIGRQTIIMLAQRISPHRALGIGTSDYCKDNWDHLTGSALWNQIQT